jgi:hypothetical protein
MKIFPLRTNLVIYKDFPIENQSWVAMKRENSISSVSNHSTNNHYYAGGNISKTVK